MLTDLRRAFVLLDRRELWRWIALVPLAVVVAGFETVGAAAIFLLVRLLADPAHAQLPVVGGLFRGPVTQTTMRTFAGAVLAFYLFRAAALVAIEFVQEHVVQATSARLAVRLFVRYLYAPYPFHFRRTSAELIQRVHENAERVVEQALAACVHLASEVCVVVGLMALLAMTAPAETAAAVAVVGVLVLAPLAVTRRLFTRWGEQERSLREDLLGDLHHSLDAVKTIILTGRQDYFTGRFAGDRARLRRLKIKRSEASTLLRLGIETAFICGMLIAVVMLTAGGRPGTAAVSTLGLFAYAGFRIVPSANRIVLDISLMRFGRAFVRSLADDWESLSDPPRGRSRPIPASSVATEIRFDTVSFGYGDGRGHAVRDVSFTIAPGESLGIVGPTGAGKSTLLDLMLGLLVPESGRILVGGRDLREDPQAWQARIGYVPQQIVIVDDSVRRNIAFGIDDAEIDDGRVIDAVRLAKLEELLASFPDGLDHRLGERGIRLSGGERQRVAIARALYGNPAVVVFDEATASLDTETERDIVNAIDAVKGGRTVVVVAHRESTVRHCDRLLRIDAGVVTTAGV